MIPEEPYMTLQEAEEIVMMNEVGIPHDKTRSDLTHAYLLVAKNEKAQENENRRRN